MHFILSASQFPIVRLSPRSVQSEVSKYLCDIYEAIVVIRGRRSSSIRFASLYEIESKWRTVELTDSTRVESGRFSSCEVNRVCEVVV